MTLDCGVMAVIFPLQELFRVSRAFLEIRKTPELKSYITFLRIPWSISGRKMIGVNILTLCHIFTMPRSPCRYSLLSKEEQKTCEGKKTVRECLEPLKSMKHNKTPGSDGLQTCTCRILQNVLV